MYNTADMVSSNIQNKNYSEKLVDTLLSNNGYESRVINRIKEQIKAKQQKKQSRPHPYKRNTHNDNCVTLKLPFISDGTTRKYKEAVKHTHFCRGEA